MSHGGCGCHLSWCPRPTRGEVGTPGLGLLWGTRGCGQCLIAREFCCCCVLGFFPSFFFFFFQLWQ